MNTEVTTTGTRPAFSITAGGFGNIEFNIAPLGEYVTTSSPLLVDEPPMVIERPFAGGQVQIPSIRYARQFSAEDNERELQEIRRGELYFITHLAELVSKYDGKFVAIIGNQVVDNDVSLDVLMERVYTRCGYRQIFMRRVHKGFERPSRLPTPRKVRTG